jgi:hypothetical protein
MAFCLGTNRVHIEAGETECFPRHCPGMAGRWYPRHQLSIHHLDLPRSFAIHGLQGLVLPLLGPATFEGGFGTAAMGLALHFFIALVVVLVFYAASRKIRVLREHAALSGVLYGVAVYLVMYWIVLPAAFPKFRHSLSNDPLAIAIHIVLIGLPTALILRRAAPSSTG